MAELWPGQGGPAIDYISGPPSGRWQHETPRGLVILGATGSIGRNALAVVGARPDFFSVMGLGCAASRVAVRGQARYSHRRTSGPASKPARGLRPMERVARRITSPRGVS